jgi:thioredoxin 1
MEINVSDSNFKQEVLDSEKPVLIDFWAEWCAPCRMLEPAVKEIASQYSEKLKVCKVNIEQAPKTASEYGIMSIPTLVIFKKGKVLDQFTGALPKSELESKLQPYL